MDSDKVVREAMAYRSCHRSTRSNDPVKKGFPSQQFESNDLSVEHAQHTNLVSGKSHLRALTGSPRAIKTNSPTSTNEEMSVFGNSWKRSHRFSVSLSVCLSLRLSAGPPIWHLRHLLAAIRQSSSMKVHLICTCLVAPAVTTTELESLDLLGRKRSVVCVILLGAGGYVG